MEFFHLTELRKKLDSKEISSVELTKFFLERIKKHEPRLNAFVTVTEEEALKNAAAADEFINTPGENPFLCGIPYAAKDLFCTKDIRTTASSKILDQYKPPFDSTVIRKLKEQKSVLLGKTNLDEFAHGSSTETSAYGPSKNPWDDSRIPGGSSGSGSCALVNSHRNRRFYPSAFQPVRDFRLEANLWPGVPVWGDCHGLFFG